MLWKFGVDSARRVAGHRASAVMPLSYSSPRYPKLPAELHSQLAKIPASGDRSIRYRPCDVVLDDGEHVRRVYVQEEQSYITMWGVWPEHDRGKYFIKIERVSRVVESADRLPARFANKLYEAGESGMGYCIFTVLFDDGSRLPVVSGNAIDFIVYPPGKSGDNVTGVLPHEGRNDPALQKAPDYRWCLYSNGA